MYAHLRRLLAGTIYLTAVMTLIAGIPHWECRCRGDQLRRLCLGLWATTCTRCQEEGSDAVEDAQSCCSQLHAPVREAQPAKRTTALPTGGARIGPASCNKVVVSSDFFVRASADEIARIDFKAVALLSLRPAAPSLLSASMSGRDDSRVRSGSAPALELVTTLQRMTI